MIAFVLGALCAGVAVACFAIARDRSRWHWCCTLQSRPSRFMGTYPGTFANEVVHSSACPLFPGERRVEKPRVKMPW